MMAGWRTTAAERPPSGADDAFAAKLVAGVMHEVNTPVGALGSTADTIGLLARRITERLGETSPELSRELALLEELASVQQATARRLESTMGALRRFVDLDRDEASWLNLATSVAGTLDMLTGGVKDRVRCSFDPTLPQLWTRAGPLHRILLHAIESALEGAGPTGEVSIDVRCLRSGKVRVAISDGGRAVDAEELAERFEPRLRPLGERVGLDLDWATTHRLARSLGGELSAESNERAGTTLAIVLPVAHDRP